MNEVIGVNRGNLSVWGELGEGVNWENVVNVMN